jgi:gliding motility-associated-like protein
MASTAATCAGNDGTATATPTGAGAVTYSWAPGGQTTQTATGLTPGTYTVSVTYTAINCVVTNTVTVTGGGAIAVPTAGSNSPVCVGGTLNLTAANITGASYSWAGPNSFTSPLQNPSIVGVTAAAAGTYTVTATVGGCTNTSTVNVTLNPVPTVTVPANITICTGGNVAASNFTSTPAGGTFTWTNSNPAIGLAANGTGNTPAFTATNATGSPISGTITVTSTVGGCVGTPNSYTITVNSGLVANAGVSDTICFGGSMVLNASPVAGGNTYAWSPATGLSATNVANPTASPTTTTVYTVTVTDAMGCSGTANVTVYVDSQITLALAGIDVTCNGANNGQTIVIPSGGNTPYTYSWSPGACTSPSCSGVGPGTYNVTVTDAWGCTATGSATVTQPTLLTVSTTGTTPATCNAACNGTATAAGNGGTAPYNFSWNTIPVQNTATATGLCAGTYTCTITDANGCTATTTATITQPTAVVIAPMTNVTICNGGSTTLTATANGGTPGYTYNWSPATGLSATNIANPTANPTVTTIYTVTATDANGCAAAPVNVTVTVNPLLSVIANGTATICPGASTPLSATASNGNGGPYTYVWSPAAGLSNPNISNPTASPASTTTYTVTANDGCSPAVTATVTVTVSAVPTVLFAADVTSGCAPLCVNFTDASAVAGGTINSWSWNFGGDGTSSAQNPTHCFVNAGTYSITLTVTDNNGCTNTATVNNMINVFAMPNASFTAPLSTSILNPTVQFIDNSSNATGWSWNFGDNVLNPTTNTSSQQNPSHTYSETGTYCATLIVTNAAGCTDTTQLCVVIDPEFTFFIPNAFSPNGDGVNDFFFGKGEFIKEYEMSIFDRWGNMIFFTDDINKGWDGRANHGSEIAQQDVYVYVVKLKDNKNQKHKYIGSVTLVK